MSGFFGNLYDFNRDGQLDAFERAADFLTFSNMMNNIEKENRVAEEGLDLEKLEFMEEDERRNILEEAGLDPDDYDF